MLTQFLFEVLGFGLADVRMLARLAEAKSRVQQELKDTNGTEEVEDSRPAALTVAQNQARRHHTEDRAQRCTGEGYSAGFRSLVFRDPLSQENTESRIGGTFAYAHQYSQNYQSRGVAVHDAERCRHC